MQMSFLIRNSNRGEVLIDGKSMDKIKSYVTAPTREKHREIDRDGEGKLDRNTER